MLPFPAVMGVLNVTPDSFSDGGSFDSVDAAKRRAEQMVSDGVSIIDVGGESTRPGAELVSEAAELDRVLPIIEAIAKTSDIPVSIDTSKPAVMSEAVAAGASLINDVRALQAKGALEAAAKLQVPVCLMHMQGTPKTMQHAPLYKDIAAEVSEFLAERMAECVAAGIAEDHLLLDPGFGFGKTDQQNLTLLSQLEQLLRLGRPVLVGLSRKSTLGAITGREVSDRKAAGVAAAVLAVVNGASIVRTHDVRETVDALRITTATLEAN